MNNRGLIFIPDISGFTRFVNEVEIDHSQHIIQELLEVIINANQLGLEVSEIEGDAILFYKYGDSPEMKDVYEQVEKMFREFHKRLRAYDHRRFCQCTACAGAIGLTLKVITHYGEFTGYNVKNFNKLIGKDIIVAHQLLKNDIEQHEYWLVTDSLAGNKNPGDETGKLNWNKGIKQTESGTIPYQYTQLTHLKNDIPNEPLPQHEIKNKVKVLSFYKEYDAEIIALLHGVVDFHTRKLWMDGVKEIEDVTDPDLPRLGTRHRCILDKGQQIMYSSSYSFSPENIVYSETDEKKTASIYSTFQKISDIKTGLTVDIYLKKNPVLLTLFNLFEKKKMERSFQRSLTNLEKFMKKVELPSHS